MLKFRKRPLSQNLHYAAAMAELHGVTVERLLDTIAKRKAVRLASFYRKRSRKRVRLNGRTVVHSSRSTEKLQAAEGEMNGLMLACNLDKAAVCELFGMHRSTFERWCGFPLMEWPCRFLRLYGWALNARAWMTKNGLDPEQFVMAPVTEYKPQGRYPRKASDIEIAP